MNPARERWPDDVSHALAEAERALAEAIEAADVDTPLDDLLAARLLIARAAPRVVRA